MLGKEDESEPFSKPVVLDLVFPAGRPKSSSAWIRPQADTVQLETAESAPVIGRKT